MSQLRDDPAAEVLLMYYDQDVSIKDIAKLKRAPIGTISSRLLRLRRKYKGMLESAMDGFEMKAQGG
jgi:DNA-directed RNA polymerase specialized sigma24 family protein